MEVDTKLNTCDIVFKEMEELIFISFIKFIYFFLCEYKYNVKR